MSCHFPYQENWCGSGSVPKYWVPCEYWSEGSEHRPVVWNVTCILHPYSEYRILPSSFLYVLLAREPVVSTRTNLLFTML